MYSLALRCTSVLKVFSKTLQLYQRTMMKMSSFCNDMAKLGGGSVDLVTDDQSGIATLTLNNPERKNSFTGKMMVDFSDCVDKLECWEAGKAVILTGAGNSFCSGGELQTVNAILSRGGEMCKHMQDITSRLFNLPLVSVAAISGHALGGGAELTTACDFRIMRRSAKVGFVQVKLNVTTGWGGGPRLVQLVGRTNTLNLLTSGKVLDAENALKIGFASDIVGDEGDIVDIARDWINKNIASDNTTTKVVKQMVVASINGAEQDGYDKERELFSQVFGSQSHIEALSTASKFKK